ncbi:eukaryotic translation initiation factor 3 subunit A-like [Mercenaria mercenaria]|uniref:eukaryotic translation initiation factor 3 subunit A-like n=1 Tax=Mercenaria mercenaria TaxID=6596 RepID=UPI00234F840D|nr:eukaryotic translation initiation factor 3 subunit A-like [Mercenaria mercenaria]
MTSVVELTKVGKELGYEGEELRNFVKEEQAREREERHSRLEAEKDRVEAEKERLELEARLQKEKIEYEKQSSLEAERLRVEAEKNRLEADRERLELEARLQKEKIEYERKLELDKLEYGRKLEQDKLEMEKEKLMLARKLETEKEEAESRRLETEHKFKTDLEKMSKKKVKVKMSPFDEKIDSMDAYLNVYETYAVAQDWDKEIWSLNLPFLLKGTAREVFDRLPLEDRKDYDKLKAALLRQFELTDDGYKKKFRTERPRDNETFVMFLARISRYLDGWLRLSKVDKTYEGLLDFILRDQFLDVCNRELYQNLSSKRLVKAKDVAEDADLFAKTRGGPKYVVNRTNKDRSYKPYEIPQRQYPSSRNVGTSNRGSSNVANRGRGFQPFGVLKCNKCGRIGHSSYYCRSGKYGGNSANAAAELEVEQEQESSKGENRNSKESRNRGRGRDRSRSRGRGRNRDRDRSKSSRSESGNSIIELSDVEELGMLSVSTCPTKPGTCNGRDVIAMRDTGCTCVIVKRNLVEASQFLEKTRRCKYIDGSEHRLDVARIDIDCPYFKGTVEALVVDNPTNDVIIGNVEGAVEPQFSSLASAVETRAQAKVKKQVKLKVPSQILDISREEFLEKQQKDSTLDLCRKKAEEGTIKQCRGKGSVRFEIRNRLLYREYTAQNLDKSRQLIVPKCLRETVMKVAHDSLLSGHLGIRKTSDRVLGEFYWPGVMAEVRRYCQSCSICQRTIAKGRVSKVPLGKMPLIDTPFKRVAVDIVGPIEPMTDRKNRYILTMVDYATRYPEAIHYLVLKLRE